MTPKKPEYKNPKLGARSLLTVSNEVHNLRIRRRERIATGTVRIQLACNSMCWLEGCSPLTEEKKEEKTKNKKRKNKKNKKNKRGRRNTKHQNNKDEREKKKRSCALFVTSSQFYT